eukprot:TRINITY_DN7416_c0_g3_i2.p1 TRINITY_DN7416_c0_g3~~TRINITY_DN7416_c0_g3_i2.p1  ORF type:complete len:382 (+),score=30.10 TRINITY_DN7416_c0_g3_i2:124-1269(+)
MFTSYLTLQFKPLFICILLVIIYLTLSQHIEFETVDSDQEPVVEYAPLQQEQEQEQSQQRISLFAPGIVKQIKITGGPEKPPLPIFSNKRDELLFWVAKQGNQHIIQTHLAEVAACVMVKDEHLDIMEWIAYHRYIGIGKFYIYDNNSVPPMIDMLRFPLSRGFVEYQYINDTFFLVNEKFEMRKLLSIVVCMLGVIMVTVVDMEMSKDQNGTNGGVVGDLVTILSAFFYASYTVAIRMMLGDDSESDMAAFFGYVGLINAVALLPVLIVCLATGAIVMANISRSSLLWVATKGLLDNVLADYLWARAVLLIGPTIATVGLSIQVPLSLVVDPMMGTPVWATDPMSILVTILGATLVLLGFYSINLEKPFSFCNVNARRAQ